MNTIMSAKEAYDLSVYNSWSSRAMRDIQPIIKKACAEGAFSIVVSRKGISDTEVDPFRVNLEALGYRVFMDLNEITIKWNNMREMR